MISPAKEVTVIGAILVLCITLSFTLSSGRANGHGGFDHGLEDKKQELLEQGSKTEVSELSDCSLHINAMQKQAVYYASVSDSFDKIRTQVTSYNDGHNPQPESYSQLLASVEVAQVDSQLDTAVFKILSFEADCNDQSSNKYQAALSIALDETKQTVQNYKDSVLALLGAYLEAEDSL